MKRKIYSQSEFVAEINKTGNTDKNANYLYVDYTFNSLIIDELTIADLNLNLHSFHTVVFKKCHFVNIDFDECLFNAMAFENCVFKNCELKNVRFIEIELKNSLFEECHVYDTLIVDSFIEDCFFVNCREIAGLKIAGCYLKLNIASSRVYDFDFSGNRTIDAENVNKSIIITSILSKGIIDNMDLKEYEFAGNQIESVSFTNSILYSHNFKLHNVGGEVKNSIDFQTIKKSEIIAEAVLKELFAIHEPDIKTFVEGLTQEIMFQTIFISYSFKDKAFAALLNGKLKAKGIITFLWQEDAPGGQYLNKIMNDNIQKHDRLLFIASKNSIKSEACQFELTKGREKYEKTWEIVLFPVHIDNYLFHIHKEDIPPKNRDSYWENIEELRRINSVDFSEFNVSRDLTNDEHVRLEKKVADLIKVLRK